MTPRERVLAAVDHRRTDRLPADYGALSGVTARLIERLGVADEEELLKALGVDMRRIRFHHTLPDSPPDADGYCRTMWGERVRTGEYADGQPSSILPFNESTTVEQIDNHPWPDATALDYSGVGPACRRHRQAGYATYGAPWSPFFHEVGWLVGQENLLIWMSTRPEIIDAIIARIVDYELDASRRFFEAADGQLDIAYWGNDFGTQRGLLISPAMWQRFIRQPLRRFYDLAHAFGLKVMQHSCGAIRALIPWLIEDGLDILDPVQTAADGMNLPGLVRDFGGRLCLHGGVDTQTTLPFGSPADVRGVVRSYRDLTRSGGGYVLCGSQQFIEDIPLDNILAMYDLKLRR